MARNPSELIQDSNELEKEVSKNGVIVVNMGQDKDYESVAKSCSFTHYFHTNSKSLIDKHGKGKVIVFSKDNEPFKIPDKADSETIRKAV